MSVRVIVEQTLQCRRELPPRAVAAVVSASISSTSFEATLLPAVAVQANSGRLICRVQQPTLRCLLSCFQRQLLTLFTGRGRHHSSFHLGVARGQYTLRAHQISRRHKRAGYRVWDIAASMRVGFLSSQLSQSTLTPAVGLDEVCLTTGTSLTAFTDVARPSQRSARWTPQRNRGSHGPRTSGSKAAAFDATVH